MKQFMLWVRIDPYRTANTIVFASNSYEAKLLGEAQYGVGNVLHYMEMGDLSLRSGEGQAHTRLLTVQQNEAGWYHFTGEQHLALHQLDVILMRKDPPFDTEFIYATYILELAELKGTLVINKPQSLRDCNEKLFTAWFPALTPDTLVSRSSHLIRQFHRQHGDIILKPLDGMGVHRSSVLSMMIPICRLSSKP